MHEDIHHISMGPYKPMRPVTETWPMLFFPIHTTNLHVGSTDYYDNVCYMGSLCTKLSRVVSCPKSSMGSDQRISHIRPDVGGSQNRSS